MYIAAQGAVDKEGAAGPESPGRKYRTSLCGPAAWSWQAIPAVLGRRADADVGDEFISGLGI